MKYIFKDITHEAKLLLMNFGLMIIFFITFLLVFSYIQFAYGWFIGITVIGLATYISVMSFFSRLKRFNTSNWYKDEY